MDKKYLEEQMSAYLDGELSPGEMSKYEQEIKAYPDLFAELQTLQRLNKLASSSQPAMPDDRYFKNLAGRIDSKIASESPGQRSRIVDFILERRKAIAVISSVAAVFLVAVISMNLFGPSAKRYPNELPGVERSTPQKSQPAPTADSVVVGKSTAPRSAPPQEARIVTSEQPTTIGDQSRSSAISPAADTSTKSPVPSIVIEVPPLVEPQPIEETVTLTLHEHQLLPKIEIKKSAPAQQILSESSGDGAESVESEAIKLRGGQTLPAGVEDSVVIFTESIASGLNKSLAVAPTAKSKSAKPTSQQSLDTGEASRNLYNTVFHELDRGVYRTWRLSAPSRASDSLLAWRDSLKIIGPARWYAEQAYRSLLANQVTYDDYLLLRAYIDHYTAETQIPDSALWNRRLPIVNDIYERQIGKQYREKK